jgi:hypothetical protein
VRFSRETALLVYGAIRDSADERGATTKEIRLAAGKSPGLVAEILGWLSEQGCIVGTVHPRRVARYRVAGPFPLSEVEKAERFDRIRVLVASGGSAVQILKKIKEVLNGNSNDK